MRDTPGIYAALDYKTSSVILYADMDMKQTLARYEDHLIDTGVWYGFGLQIKNTTATVYLNNKPVLSHPINSPPPNGFVSYGTTTWGYAYFDNVVISDPR